MNKWLSIALLVFCGSLYAQTCGGSCRCGDCPTDPNPPRPAPRISDIGHNDCDAWPGRCSGRPQFEEVFQSGASPETAPKAACPRGYHLIWIWDNIDPLTPFGHWACTSDLVAQQPQPCMIAPGVPCQTIPLGQGRNG